MRIPNRSYLPGMTSKRPTIKYGNGDLMYRRSMPGWVTTTPNRVGSRSGVFAGLKFTPVFAIGDSLDDVVTSAILTTRIYM